jgi:hypothetical protein
VAELLPKVEKERQRRIAVYGDLAPWLYDIPGMSLFKLTHTARAHRCVTCNRRIPPYELHFVVSGIRSCQRGPCCGLKPDLRLASLDGVLIG